MFVADWSSLDDDDNNNNNSEAANDAASSATADNGCGEASEAGKESTTADDLNGVADTAGPTVDTNEERPSTSSPTNDDNGGGIELSIDITAGDTASLTNSNNNNNDSSSDDNLNEENGDGMDQCQMWASSTPQDDEEVYDNPNTTITTSNPLSTYGDIWSTEAFAFDSPLKDLLDTNSYTLHDLLRQDELLQELRGCESRLVEYFSRPEVVAGLVDCLVGEGSVAGMYLGEERGRERWIEQERERRRRRKSGGGGALEREGSIDEGERRYAPTVEATTDETSEDPHVETLWNSPVKMATQFVKDTDAANDNNIDNSDNEEERTPEEEYDLRYVRYPYMACEVLCSEVGVTLDVLVDGYVQDIIADETMIDDDDDSLLNDSNAKDRMQEIKTKEVEEQYDDIDVFFDENGDSEGPSLTSTFPLHRGHQLKRPAELLPSPTAPSTPQQQHQQQSQTPQRRILDLLFSVLIDTPPASLDDRRAGYLEKILVVLFRKRSQAMADYMNTSIIVTSESAGMAREILTKEILQNGDNGDSAAVGESVDPLSTYVSLSQRNNSMDTEADADPSSPPYTPSTVFHELPLVMSNFPSPNAPPMLMCALFDHLHSHSVMHIIQRLLLPSPARQQQNSNEANTEVGSGALDSDEAYNENPNSAINSEFMNAINQMNSADNQQYSTNDDGDDEDDLENATNHLFQCDWSERPGHALELLMARLEGRTEPFLIKYGFPVGYDASQWSNDERGEQVKQRNEEAEAAAADASLSCSQHASEILITIIQHSPLESPVMVSLSSDPALERILKIALLTGEDAVFVAHESSMTCAMSVMESLVLQLGGYGSVTSLVDEDAQVGEDNLTSPASPPSSDVNKTILLSELGPHTPTTVSSPATGTPQLAFATCATLLQHLPKLLKDLSSLLVHPITKTWVTPAQYTNGEPRPLLGTSRLRVLRLLESLVLLGDPTVDKALRQSDCLELCLDLFWQFEWCSMLHQSVANLLVHVFEGGEARASLQEYFIDRCRILEKLMGSFESEMLVLPLGVESVKIRELPTDVTPENGTDGEMVLAMKRLYQSEKVTSSVESERGSESDGNDDEAVAPVSEDDVDSAMEKEEQENNALKGTASEEGAKDEVTTPQAEVPPSPARANTKEDASFRKGYMGHVIIICQALVHACNATSQSDAQCEGEELAGVEVPNLDVLTDGEVSNASDSEISAVVSLSEDYLHSKKRKDRPPSLESDDDLKRHTITKQADAPIADDLFSPMSPISKVPSSPNEVEAPTNSPVSYESKSESKSRGISAILRRHHLYNDWELFVASSLAAEMTTQSTPLGGHEMTKDSGASVASEGHMLTIDDTTDNDFLGGPADHGVFGGMVVGELDMDENDLDIAASMMEALSLPPSVGSGDSEDGAAGHRRRGGRNEAVLGGGSRIGNFGSVIQGPGAIGTQEYVYDDPLGGHPFETDDSSDEEEKSGDNGKTSEDDDFMSDAMVVSKDGASSTQNSSASFRSDSVDSDDTGDDDDDDVPVMDLFAGNFSFDDAAETTTGDESNPFGTSSAPTKDDDVGWANFDSIDAAFATNNQVSTQVEGEVASTSS